MIIIITGGTGFIGQSLIQKLKLTNHILHALVRSLSHNPIKHFIWPDVYSPLDKKAFPQDSKYGVIHLAGEPISKWPWTHKRKQKIYDSRVLGTRQIVTTIHNLKNPPQFFIAVSATGIYGHQKQKNIKEPINFKNQDLFLQQVCKDWEQEILKLQSKCRVVLLRLGIVLSFKGGFLKQQLKLCRLFVPSILCKNNLWMSWIHKDDLVRLILFAIHNKDLQGIYNATAPEPFDINTFFNQLSTYLKKSYLRIPIPLFLLKLLGGEMVKNLLVSCHTSSQKILKTGFQFKYNTLQDIFKFDLAALKVNDQQSQYKP